MTGWFRTTEICPLTVLKAQSPKSRCREELALSEGSRGEPFLASSGFWSSLVCGCMIPISPPSPRDLLPSLLLSLTGPPAFEIRAPLDNLG